MIADTAEAARDFYASPIPIAARRQPGSNASALRTERRRIQCDRLTARVRKTTILVVEDDPTLRTLYTTALSAAGYAVAAVEDGMDALRRVEREPPDAVILDLALPRMGGRDVQQELKAHESTRDIPIVVVTGTDTRSLDSAGFACVLRKPVDTDALIAAVVRCIRRHHH